VGRGWDDRQERTRADVLAAARALIVDVGVDGLSMRKLADRAGVAVGTLYNQFGDRDGVLVAFVDAGLDSLEEQVDASPAATPIETTRLLLDALDATLAAAVDVWKPVFAVIKTGPDIAGLGDVGDRFVAMVEHDLDKAAASGMFRVDVDTARLAEHIIATRMSRVERWATDDLTWDEYVAASRLGLELVLAAVLVEPLASDALRRSGVAARS
jgi:AcrR family transcriptional regulator